MAETAYGFNTRFGDGNPNASRGTNPEQLIAAAHAACFTMAPPNALAQAGHAPDAVDTRADVDLSMDGRPTISSLRLPTQANVPVLVDSSFPPIADHSKRNRGATTV